MLLLALLLAAAPPLRADRARVVVIRNEDSPTSIDVADDYLKRRAVQNVVSVHCLDSAASAANETITFAKYQTAIEAPLKRFLATHSNIDFVVMTKGVPIRIADCPVLGLNNGRVSVDSYIAAMDYNTTRKDALIKIDDSGFKGGTYANRFWNSAVPFSHAKFGGYLVTRLDGYTREDAIALTTRALEAEMKAPVGEVLLDTCPDFGYDDTAKQPLPILKPPATGSDKQELADVEYKVYNGDMRKAAEELKALNVPFELDETQKFIGDTEPLMGYCSWGSNDRHFDPAAYHRLKFAPGGICETAVSTSARTFLPTSGGQSMIADMIAQGATGAKGYCDEPLLIAVASPAVLFDRYTRGWTLAESYYAASRFVGWEDIVLGDPLCRPYPVRKSASHPAP